jgi:hypothetical protein
MISQYFTPQRRTFRHTTFRCGHESDRESMDPLFMRRITRARARVGMVTGIACALRVKARPFRTRVTRSAEAVLVHERFRQRDAMPGKVSSPVSRQILSHDLYSRKGRLA